MVIGGNAKCERHNSGHFYGDLLDGDQFGDTFFG
jgi:hypothetical protein